MINRASAHSKTVSKIIILQKFATHNYNIERQRCTEDKVWPFALVMDDSCAAWTMSKWSKTDHTDKYVHTPHTHTYHTHYHTLPGHTI